VVQNGHLKVRWSHAGHPRTCIVSGSPSDWRADPGTGCSAATASSGWGRVMTDRNQSESEPVDIKRYAGGKWDGNLLLDPEFDDDLPPLVEIKRLVS
jgi:hypothetical protein